jgi:hypothetical protein
VTRLCPRARAGSWRARALAAALIAAILLLAYAERLLLARMVLELLLRLAQTAG